MDIAVSFRQGFVVSGFIFLSWCSLFYFPPFSPHLPFCCYLFYFPWEFNFTDIRLAMLCFWFLSSSSSSSSIVFCIFFYPFTFTLHVPSCLTYYLQANSKTYQILFNRLITYPNPYPTIFPFSPVLLFLFVFFRPKFHDLLRKPPILAILSEYKDPTSCFTVSQYLG